MGNIKSSRVNDKISGKLGARTVRVFYAILRVDFNLSRAGAQKKLKSVLKQEEA